ncbi:hypothetical protein HYZ70_02685 [Candidatus Curtissbacteria bacterium]|nr:hypothetical protein [Candidatus Curtissbacteria bacterium]
MFRKLFVSLIAAIFITLFAPAFASAQEATCVQVYGGGVICGAQAPEHKPVETGLTDNLATVGLGFVLTSGALLFLSRKVKA